MADDVRCFAHNFSAHDVFYMRNLVGRILYILFLLHCAPVCSVSAQSLTIGAISFQPKSITAEIWHVLTQTLEKHLSGAVVVFSLSVLIICILLIYLIISRQQLSSSEQRFKALHNASFGGITIHDKGLILDCNKGLSQITGYEVEELIGMDGLLLIAPGSRKEVMDNIVSGTEKAYEVYGLRKNGEEFPVRLEARNIPYKGRQVRVVEFRDITEEKEHEKEREVLEERLRQAQKMEAIGTLAGGVAHDFNNMLGGILGAAELLAGCLSEDSKAQKYQKIIVQAARRATSLTEQLLAFSRTSPKTSTPVDLHDVIRQTVVLVKNTVDKRISVQTFFSAEESTVIGDPSLLQSMFLNLCINSAHAMPEGGSIEIRTRVVESNEVDGTLYGTEDTRIEPGKYIAAEVRDTGQGIAPEHLSKIFDPFFTTKKQGRGTGLGLASVYGTVQQHNGVINVSSEIGVGTVFHLLFPLCGAEKVELAPTDGIIQGKGCVLIVDDEDVMRATAEAILEELGYQVVSVENGRQALEVFEKERTKIDLVILDMVMPVMNGRDCFKELLKLDPEVTAVLSSGFTREEDLKDMLDAGLKGFIRKPYSKAGLSRIVSEALGKETTA